MLEDFKSDMLHAFALQMDTMQEKEPRGREPWPYFFLDVPGSTQEMNVHWIS